LATISQVDEINASFSSKPLRVSFTFFLFARLHSPDGSKHLRAGRARIYQGF
jgi:hypothetical protein